MKNIAVFFGGRSPEHDVSIVTALSSVIRPLELMRKYTIVPVYIAKTGAWYVDERLKDIKFFQQEDYEKKLSQVKSTGVVLANGMKLLVPSRVGRKEVDIDLVFPAMHGAHGEDGQLMGVFEMANVPYVGCGVTASTIAMDKVLAKQVAEAYGLKTAPWLSCSGQDAVDKADEIVNRATSKLSWPMFVKPAHLGSSIGISKATNEMELRNALEVAAHYDGRVLIEQAIQNLREVTLPVLGNEELRPALLEEPLTQAEDFFDFETKYMQGGKKNGQKTAGQAAGAQGYSNLPARLPDKLYKKAEKVGLDAYRALGCAGTARIDMLIDTKNGEVYFNEANPLPGSLYAHNWREAGISGVELVEELVKLAEERHANVGKYATTFSTSFLKQF